MELWAKFIVLETRIHDSSLHGAYLGSKLDPHTFHVLKCVQDVVISTSLGS